MPVYDQVVRNIPSKVTILDITNYILQVRVLKVHIIVHYTPTYNVYLVDKNFF